MKGIDIRIEGQHFELRSDEDPEHVQRVAELVQKKIGEIRRGQPSMSAQKATILAALHFASAQQKCEREQVALRASISDRVGTWIQRIDRMVDGHGGGASEA